MARTLSVARVKVAAERQGDYLAAIRDLATIAAMRGQHIWVFKSQRDPELFLEFSESPTPLSHRNVASRTQEELQLERRLLAAGSYGQESGELWDEVVISQEA